MINHNRQLLLNIPVKQRCIKEKQALLKIGYNINILPSNVDVNKYRSHQIRAEIVRFIDNNPHLAIDQPIDKTRIINPSCIVGKQELCDIPECISCYDKSFAQNPKAAFWSKRNEVTPRQINKGFHKHYYFDCPDCGHEIYQIISAIHRAEKWCKYCSHNELCNNKECNFCFSRSFASHEKAIYWSNKNIKSPRDVALHSGEYALFDCIECGHELNSCIRGISRGHWCCYCSHSKLCSNQACQFCFNVSFASHEKAIYWSKKNQVKPRDLVKGSSDCKYFFDCPCGHEINMTLNSINSGSWCKYCGHSELCNNDQCLMCYNNSFASSKFSRYFSIKNGVSPRQLFKCSPTKYSFICEKEHEYTNTLNHSSDNRGCPYCVNKTEGKMYEILSKRIHKTINKQSRFEWCKGKTGISLPFDFSVDNIIIELDGDQHFKQVGNWQDPQDTYDRDIYKMKCANNNGYSMIRIYQDDVWRDRIDWYGLLINAIDKIDNEGIIQNIYISSGNYYSQYPISNQEDSNLKFIAKPSEPKKLCGGKTTKCVQCKKMAILDSGRCFHHKL